MALSPDLTGLTAASSVFLLLAVSGLWIHRLVALSGLAVAVIFAALAGHSSLAGTVALAGFAGLAWWYRRTDGWLAWAALVTASAVFFLHLVPGISGWPVQGPVQIGAGAVYEKWLSLDKVGVGVLLLALALPNIYGQRGWCLILKKAWPWILGVPIASAALAVLSGAIHWDVTPVTAFWLWAVLNLFSVCVVEEALFRGLIQTRLVTACRMHEVSPWVGVAVSASLFGLAHGPGGAALVAFATLAGMGYGFAFHLTGRIEAAILTHFALNSVHFLFFTYPITA